MGVNSVLLFGTAPLIVVAAFCLVFSFDVRKTRKSRLQLFIAAIVVFCLIAAIMYRLFRSPLA